MSREIFKNIVQQKKDSGAKKESLEMGQEFYDEKMANAIEREQLLALLPEELQIKSEREKFSLDHIKKIVEFRENKGYKIVVGYHVSPLNFNVGSAITGGIDSNVHFSTNLESIYLGKGSGYLYALECSEKLMKTTDENLNWYTLLGSVRIIDKIKMTPEVVEQLGIKFSECDYS